jgi:hypothetical protein
VANYEAAHESRKEIGAFAVQWAQQSGDCLRKLLEPGDAETHLHSVFGKLEVPSRNRLMTLMR